MATDLDIIAKLEKEIGKELPRFEIEKVSGRENGFAVNNQDQVVGLNLDNVQKESVQPLIKALKNLESLSLHSAKFEDCAFLSGLSQLTKLWLGYNKLTDVKPLSGLSQLTNLWLYDNKLTDVTPLSGLSQLKELYLSDNKLTDVKPLSGLSQLTELSLGSNQLTNVTPLSGLSQLTKLWLGSNQLTDVTPLSGLSQLRYLNIVDNKINEYPLEMLVLELKIDVEEKSPGKPGIYLAGNPLEQPPLEILKQGREAALAYFRALEKEKGVGEEEEEIRPVNEVKALLVGGGGAGKTSLVKCLMGKDFDENESQTHGINIDDWPITVDNREIKVNLWDFGGQAIMHATHQFFLSKRSLYILVLDGRRDEKTEYWLKLIESFGGDSPVLVVINKIDENPGFDVNRKFLRDKYPNIKGFFRLSCATKKGSEEFHRALQEELAQVEMMSTTWPASWFKVKTRLEDMKRDYISYKEYEKICAEAGITEEKSRDTLVDFLHDLGVALHFKELELENTHVLEPEWATGAVYKIINSPLLADNKGILKMAHLPQILNKESEEDFEYPKDKYPFIIQLMIKFEICYQMNKNRALIPDLLQVEEVEFDFDYEDSLKFVLEYDFLPKSVMPRFIVKMHEDIENQLRWRTGVVLKSDMSDSRALVKSDEMDEKIFIYVSGEQKQDFFAVIRHAFQVINKSFEKLKVDEMVPLPGNEQELVKYKDLIGLELARRDELFIGSLGRAYNVPDLLNGLVKRENRLVEQKALINIVQGDMYWNSEKHQTLNIDKSQTTINIQQIKNIHLPAVQGDFAALKKMLAKADPALKEELKEISDSLDELGPGSDKEKYNKPLNKLGRFIKDLADQDTPLGKTVAGLEKAVDLGQKIGRTYNKIAQWLALPQVPDILLGKKD